MCIRSSLLYINKMLLIHYQAACKFIQRNSDFSELAWNVRLPAGMC